MVRLASIVIYYGKNIAQRLIGIIEIGRLLIIVIYAGALLLETRIAQYLTVRVRFAEVAESMAISHSFSFL